MEHVSIGLAVMAGLLSFISPCVLPLAPAYIGYMAGRVTRDFARQSVAGSVVAGSASRLRMLLHGMAFVAGFTLVFVLIGLMTTAFASVAGKYVGALTESIGRIGGAVIILFGLHFMGVASRLFGWLRGKDRAALIDNPLFSAGLVIVACGLIYWGFAEETAIALPVCAGLIVAMAVGGAFTKPGRFWGEALDRAEALFYADTRSVMDGGDRGGLLGSAFMGVVFSAGWTPCIGPLLGAILTLAATSGASTGDIGQGMILLAAYSIGLGIPFILTALLLENARGALRRLQSHLRAIERFSGVLLIVIGVAVASGRLQSLSQTFSRGEFADFTFRLEECGLGFLGGQLQLSHLGPCLEGTLVPVALNQSASGQFRPDAALMQIVFQGRAGDSIDLEAWGIGEDRLDFTAALYGPDESVAARGSAAESIHADGKLYPLTGVELVESGIYRVVLDGGAVSETARFRVKARSSQPILADAAPESDGLKPAIGELIADLGAIVAELGPSVGLAEGDRAPDFTITTLDGETMRLSDLRGGVTLLNFWGTWCGPCRREMPEFQKFYAEWKGAGLAILAVAWNDTAAAMAEFRDEYALEFPLALDASGEINELYAVQTRPTTYVIARDGTIHARHFGIMTEPQLRELFRELFPQR